LEWWIRDADGGGEKLLLHSEESQKSTLDYGPLIRQNHNNQISCEAKNTNMAPPVLKKMTLQLICK
jgi:hypothetical protein